MINQELLAARAAFKLGSSGLGEGGIVAGERNAAIPELWTLLLESESESIIGGSEMVRQRRAKKDALHVAHLDYTPYWLVHAIAAYPVIAVEASRPPRTK